ncbi:hypothetical protein BGX30_006108 [Mortierella sp. GBA39]|nr:hypothetical protein BGX30_006108 [Mortierella sp. GBA39]
MALTIRIGPSRQQESLKPYPINRDSEPAYISSEHFEGLITVRIQHHHPTTSSSSPTNRSTSTCAYFDNHSRVFSLQWQGRFKATNPWSKDGLWDADEVLFVAEVEGKIHVPMGTSIATAFARTIDPSFIADGIWDLKRPWVGSPLVSGMNVLRVWKAPLSPTSDSASPTTATAITISTGTGGGFGDYSSTESHDRGGYADGEDKGKRVGPWVYHGTHRLKEGHVDLLAEAGARRQQLQVSSTVTTASMDSIATPSTETTATGQRRLQRLPSYQRRRYFTKTEHRQAAVFAPDLVIAGDFFNNFTNFETRRVSMGISIRMDRVLRDDQPLRFVCKSRRRLSQKQRQQGQGHGERPIKGRNRKRRNKHEVGSTTLSGGGRSGRIGGDVKEEEEQMDIAIEDSDHDDDVDVDGGEGDERQEEMDDKYDDREEEEEEIVFFVVELRWGHPGGALNRGRIEDDE